MTDIIDRVHRKKSIPGFNSLFFTIDNKVKKNVNNNIHYPNECFKSLENPIPASPRNRSIPVNNKKNNIKLV